MARREPRQPTVLKVRVTCAPHRGTPACVAHAYAPIVPWPCRPVVHKEPAAQGEAEHTQPVGSRNASCTCSTPPSTHGCRRTNKRPRTLWPAKSPRCRSASPWLGWCSPILCSCSMKATVAPHESGQRWSGSAMAWPPAPLIASTAMRRLGWHVRMPSKSYEWMNASVWASRSCSYSGTGAAARKMISSSTCKGCWPSRSGPSLSNGIAGGTCMQPAWAS